MFITIKTKKEQVKQQDVAADGEEASHCEEGREEDGSVSCGSGQGEGNLL